MATIPGGITSRPSGKVGNIVFGAARTPEGKVATARQLVTPSNPDTPAQQQQRGKFDQSLSIVQNIGPGIYQDDWNRAVGQLPGFQSWMSVLLNNIDNNDVLQPPPTRPLGDLYLQDGDPTLGSPAAGSIGASYATSAGSNGTGSDVAVLVGIEAAQPGGGGERHVDVETSRDRSDGSAAVTGFPSGVDVVTAFYFRGQGTADGLLSNAVFGVATTQ